MKTATQHLSTPQCQGAGWHVPSAGGGGTYYVEFSEGGARCTCPSWVYGSRRRGACKHIMRVMAMVTTEVAIGD
jgi:hypothetical protein